MDLAVEFSSKPELQLRLIRLLGLLASDCNMDDFRKVPLLLLPK